MTALCLSLPLLVVSFAAVAVLHRRCLRLVAQIELRERIIRNQYDQIDRLRRQIDTQSARPFEDYIKVLDI